MHTIIQYYSPTDVVHKVDREGEKKIKHRNMHTIIQYYSPTDVVHKVDREGEKK